MTKIEIIAEFVARSFWRLEQELGSSDAELLHFVERLGWILPEVPAGLRNLKDASSRVSDALLVLEEKRRLQSQRASNEGEVSDAAATLLEEVALLAAEIHQLPDALRCQLPVDYLAATSIADEFVKRLFDWLLVRLLNQQNLVAYHIAVLLGFMEIKEKPADPAKHQPEFVRYTIHWNRLPLLFQDPSALLQDVYGWGTPTLNAKKFFDAIMDFSFALALPAELHYPVDAFIQAVAPHGIVSEETGPDPQIWFPLVWTETVSAFLVTYVLPKAIPDELQGLATTLVLSGEAMSSIPLARGLTLNFEGQATLGSGAALVIRPDRPPTVVLDAFESAQAFTSGHISARLSYESENGQPLLSEKGGSRLEAQELFIGGIAKVMARGAVEALVEAGIVKGKLVISPTEADSFLQRILPQDPAEIDLDVTFGISSAKGFYVKGAAGFEYTFIVNKSSGPIFINSVDLKLEASEENLILITAASGGAKIGPVTAVVQEFGLKTMLEFGKPGLLGNADLSIGFKAPNGIGLSVDAEGITGGGFLIFDPPNYAGMMQLSFQNEIDVTAFGLITTKLPDGKDGYSLVIQILAEFQPIQIGLGFALTGVGGLIGINRQLCEEGMKKAFKTHSLGVILFLVSPIKDDVKLMEAIQPIMPPKEGFHIFGPLIKLFWGGSMKLINFEIGIFIQLGGPQKIILMGQAWSHLPSEDSPRLVINVDVLGIIDFGEERVAIDATLFDSRILNFTLDGQMALRADWSSGEENFALSVGGFNPRFHNIPPGFPRLRRLIVSIGDNPHLTLTMYLAITPNTLQVGAQLEIWAKKSGFTVEGGAGFNALFAFSPFSFVTDVRIWVTVSKWGFTLGVWLVLELSGPNPIIASGYAKFKVGWFTKKVRFRKEFGKKVPEPLPLVSPLAALRTELEHPSAIRFRLPAWASANLVFTTDVESKIDPIADVIIIQNAVPLNFTLEKFGGGIPPETEKRLSITAGLGSEREEAAQSLFAPEQFKNWSIEQRLSAKPFEKYDAGIRFSGEYVIPEDHKEEREIVFETVLRESKQYLNTLRVTDYRNIAVRTACLWQPSIAEAELLNNWSNFGSGSYYQPLRVTRDDSSPNFVKVLEPSFRLSGSTAHNGKFVEAAIAGQMKRDLPFAEALDIVRSLKDENIVIRNKVDTEPLEG